MKVSNPEREARLAKALRDNLRKRKAGASSGRSDSGAVEQAVVPVIPPRGGVED
jgi:hypothetical protein